MTTTKIGSAVAPVSATTAPEVKANVRDMADKIKKAMTLDPKTGSAEISDGFYIECLPETLTESQLRTLSQHNAMMLAAGALAVGEVGLTTMGKHKTLEKATMKMATVDKDSFSWDFQRSKEVNDGKGGKMEKYGAITTTVATYGYTDVGQLAKVRKILGAQAREAFANL